MNYDFLSLKDAAKLLGLHEAKLREAIKQGELTAFDAGNRYKVRKEWLDLWVERKTVNPEASKAGGK